MLGGNTKDELAFARIIYEQGRKGLVKANEAQPQGKSQAQQQADFQKIRQVESKNRIENEMKKIDE